MSNPIELLQRNQFFNGQRLFAGDLNELDSYQRAMRQLHNVSLHQHGVGSGFAISAQPGAREIMVGPGYAIDVEGREIVNTETRQLPIPTVHADSTGKPVGYYLAISYRDDERLEELETRESVCSEALCQPSGTVRFKEEPDFCWIRLSRVGETFKPVNEGMALELESGKKIVLCRIEVLECKLEGFSIETRRNARPDSQPYLRCGHSQPLWHIQVDRLFRDDGLSLLFLLAEAEIDTSEAAFVNIPCYSARIEGKRIIQLEAGGPRFLVEGLTSVSSPAAARFTAQMMAIVASDTDDSDQFEDFKNKSQTEGTQAHELWTAIQQAWKLVWMGSE